MKKYILPAALVILLIVLGYKSCGLYDRYSELKGRYDALAEEYDTYKDGALKRIDDLNETIEQLDETIAGINRDIDLKNDQLTDLHARTDELESTYTKLTDLSEKVDNLETQVSTWKQKFTLAQSIIADKDAIIFSLNEKYEAQVEISLNWKTLYEHEATLRTLAEVRLKLADKKLRGLQFQLNLTRGVTLALGVGIIYSIVAK